MYCINASFYADFKQISCTVRERNKLYSTGTEQEQERNMNGTRTEQEQNILVEINKLYVCFTLEQGTSKEHLLY